MPFPRAVSALSGGGNGARSQTGLSGRPVGKGWQGSLIGEVWMSRKEERALFCFKGKLKEPFFLH